MARIRVDVVSGFAGDHPTLIDSQVESIQSTSVTWTGNEADGGNNDSRCYPWIENCLTRALARSLSRADIKSRLQGICIRMHPWHHQNKLPLPQSKMPCISAQSRRVRLLGAHRRVPVFVVLCSRLIDYSRGVVIGTGQSSHRAISHWIYIRCVPNGTLTPTLYSSSFLVFSTVHLGSEVVRRSHAGMI